MIWLTSDPKILLERAVLAALIRCVLSNVSTGTHRFAFINLTDSFRAMRYPDIMLLKEKECTIERQRKHFTTTS